MWLTLLLYLVDRGFILDGNHQERKTKKCVSLSLVECQKPSFHQVNSFLVIINNTAHWVLYWPFLLPSEGKCCTQLGDDGQCSLPCLFRSSAYYMTKSSLINFEIRESIFVFTRKYRLQSVLFFGGGVFNRYHPVLGNKVTKTLGVTDVEE